MNEFCVIQLESPTPLITAAIHDGHKLSESFARLSALKDIERLREEDPFTGNWAMISENRIIARHSRFEFDLNRPPGKAIYLKPEDAWGLNLWIKEPSEQVIRLTLDRYNSIYERIHDGLTALTERFGKVVILDLHSYNHRRGGPDAPPDDPLLNPEINVGTGTMDRGFWAPVVDRFLDDLRSYDFQGRQLDIRENIKFRGGYFPRWVHENFKESACCISVEVKKIFMDEWSCEPYKKMTDAVSDAIKCTVAGLVEEISK